ncbi:MAG: redox-regulated ATPase YchF [Thermodesulfobacteriota bacterium]|nr:redox-regulated ATPase YchF [Thermodesulfobacteriota bacterium]
MGFVCGVVGLPNVGKTTIFNALTSGFAQASNYPFCTIDPNAGVVDVKDLRLARVSEIIKPERIVPTTIEFKDIAGLVKGASKGEGLGNQFLSYIRDVHAIVHVVRCFQNPHITHVSGVMNPLKDIDVVNTELILADLQVLENRIQKIKKRVQGGDKHLVRELKIITKLSDFLNNGNLARSFNFTREDDRDILKDMKLLTMKPMVYVANVSEEYIYEEDQHTCKIKERAFSEGNECITLCGKLEAEVAQLTPYEKEEYEKELIVGGSGLEQLVDTGYRILDLITFFTTRSKEVRAWTIKNGTDAVSAASKIHTDFAQGFIKAEVIHYSDLDRLGSEIAIREEGFLHIEGKHYIVQDGDILYFKFRT